MNFTSISEIAKKRSSKSGRAPSVQGITVSQVHYKDREKPSRIMTIRIADAILSQARMNKGDRVDIAFSENGMTWRIKLLPQDSTTGYSISAATKTSTVGVIRFTWYEGMPLLGGDSSIIKAKSKAGLNNIKTTPAEIIFTLETPQLEY